MGRPKALLAVPDGRTFVHRLLATLRDGGIAAPVVVGRVDDAELRREVESHGAIYIANANADAGGQLSSLLAGLEAVDRAGVRALMIVPVDAPLVEADTVAALMAVFDSTLAPIVRPRFEGRHGHPVIFSREVFDELRQADPAAGAKAVLRAHERAIVNVDVQDPGVIGDVDTPAAYHAMFHRNP
jgi:molybdenum cofactor cytidylyltransferase